MQIPLTKPFINQEVRDKINEVLTSGYLTEGKITKLLEESIEEYTGCSHAIAVTSATTGLEVALRAIGIGPGDEVIVPDYTFPATAAVGPIVGAKSVIVDCSKDTMLIDYERIEAAINDNTKAIIPVSCFGNPLDYNRLNKIKTKYGLYIIEDAACALGSEYNKKKTGNLADITVFSFHPRKFISTGEGGMITTNNPHWAEWINSYKHFGMKTDGQNYQNEFEIIGTNYKLSNVLAAIGLIQMKYIDTLLNQRRKLAEYYMLLLKDNDKVIIPCITPGGKHSYQSFCIFIENRDRVLKHMRESGIEVQIGTYALHKHKAFKNGKNIILKGDLAKSDYIYHRCLTLPLYHELTESMQDYIINKLIEML